MPGDKRSCRIDRNVLGRKILKVKVKYLSEEARIIRKEEHRSWGSVRESLHLHRTQVVRPEARASHIAYGLLRGKTVEQIEGRVWEDLPEHIQNRVTRMLNKYARGLKGMPMSLHMVA